MAYIRADVSGNYSHPATWVGGVVPGLGDIACADTRRVTLDIDPLATLSVAAADLVEAGGSLGQNKTGGFTVPAGATRVIAGGLRYDFYMISARNTSSTVPLYITHGDVTIGDIVYVYGYAATTTAMYAVLVETNSIGVKVTTNGINCPTDIANIPTSNTVVVMLKMAGNVPLEWVSNGALEYVGGVATASSPPILVETSNVSFPFEITINGYIGAYGGTVSTKSTVLIAAGNTAQPDQNITVTASSMAVNGTVSSSAGKSVTINNVHNVTFTNDVSIGDPSVSITVYEVAIASLRGTLWFAGDLTLLSRASLSVTGIGHVQVDGTTYIQGSYSTACFGIDTTGDITFASIECTSPTAYNGTVGAVTIVGAPNSVSVVGDLRFGVGHIATAPIIAIASATSAPLHITGDVDATNMYITGASPTGALYLGSNYSGPVTVDGGVFGPNAGTYAGISLNTGAIHVAGSATPLQPMTISGDVVGGSRGVGLISAAGAIVSIRVLGAAVGGTVNLGMATAAPAIVSYNADLAVGSMAFGPQGQFPVFGLCRFIDTMAATLAAVDVNGTGFALVSGVGIIPAATDVRAGVAVGAGAGTLVLPQPSTVLGGIVYDNNTVGTLDLATDVAAIKAKTDQLAFTMGNVHALSSDTADVAAIKAKTDQLTFTLDGVVADSSGVAADYTARFNALDTVTAGIKAKTDQLTFTVSGVVADAGGADYTARFNTLDANIALIPTLNYTTRFNSIDADLATLTAGGGVDFTPVLSAIANVDADVASVATNVNGIKAKTDQLTFSTNGVDADVAVSVGQVINYDSRFTALDTEVAAVKAKTNQLTFTANGVVADAAVDTAPIVVALSDVIDDAIAPVGVAVASIDTDLQTHDAEIKAQLTTIQNATGAIDLTPITLGLATVNTNVLAIPTTNYTTRFNTVDTLLTVVQQDIADLDTALGSISVDLNPVLTAVAGVQADTNALQVAVANVSVDLNPVLTAVAGVQTTANGIKVKTDTITACDTSALAGAIDALEQRFDVVPDGAVSLIPQASASTTTLYGYCMQQNGAPAVGESVTVYVQQAGGSAALLTSAGQVITSGADGLVSCTVPRGTQYVYAVKYGTRVERVYGVDGDTLAMPSIIKR